jgi:hypothetical protein
MKWAAFVLAAAALFVPAAADAGSAGSYVQVVEKEYSLVLSRQSVRSGSVTLEAINFGMDAHNLALRKTSKGAPTIRFRKLFHGAHIDRALKLAPGRYTLWCTLSDHRKRGMVATLVVAR